MAVKWTVSQQKIIDHKAGDLLVAAGAGSGKTAVLTEHIVHKITDESDPTDLDQLLVVTFTNAAAAEMKERIRNKLETRLADDPDNENLIRQIGLVGCADISTIHSFCLKVIRDNFYRLDIDPSFRIGDNGELKLMQNDLTAKLFESQYEQKIQSFLDFRDIYSSNLDDDALSELIISLYEYSRSYPDPEKWLELCEKDELKWIDGLYSYIHELAAEYMRKAQDIYDRADAMGAPQKFLDVLEDDLDIYKDIAGQEDLFLLTESFDNHKFKRKPTVSKKNDKLTEEEADFISDIFDDRAALKKKLESMKKSFGVINDEDLKDQREESHFAVEEIVRLVRLFSEEYSAKKKSLGICDFSDLEHMAIQILYDNGVPNEAARTCAGKYKEVLIDEYQDCSFIQESILRAVSRECLGLKNRFMVGDVKQSIYGFRQARPELFLEKYDSYSEEDSAECQKVELSSNFRSRSGILAAINMIFSQIMTKTLGGIVYDDKAALHPGTSFPERGGNVPDVDVCLLDLNEDEEENNDEARQTDYNKNELQARIIGKAIIDMTKKNSDFCVLDSETLAMRPAKYSDIVIIMRSLASYQEDYVRALKEMGIPVCVENDSGYFTSPEVSCILNYLKIIDNPMQDIPLAAVLRSPFCGMSAEELARIRIEGDAAGERCSFYTCCMNVRDGFEKLDSFFKQLERYRILSRLIPLDELIERIVDETGFGFYVSALPQGEKRLGNLEMLKSKAKTYENISYKGLFHFIRYIDKLKKYDNDSDFSQSGEETCAVRIMTIHKSKGLEFPVVILANTSADFTKAGSGSRKVIADGKYGIAVDVYNREFKYTMKSRKKLYISRMHLVSQIEEELRLLYVALTRAREKLVIIGSSGKLSDSLQKWSKAAGSEIKPMEFGSLTSAKTYLDWLMSAFITAAHAMGQSVSLDKDETCCFLQTPDYSARFRYFSVPDAAKSCELAQEPSLHENEHKISDKLCNVLTYKYPYEALRDVRAAVSVTQLKKEAQKDSDVSYAAAQDKKEPEKRTAREYADRGTAYHRVMELLSFKKYCNGTGGIKEDIDQLVRSKKLGEKEAKEVFSGDIAKFFESEIGRHCCMADKKGSLYKEEPFLLGIRADELDENALDTDDLVLVRGIIDCFFIEDGKITLIDYKTDRVNESDGEDILTARYGIQLRYYKRAIESALNMEVEKVYIYSFSLKRFIGL